MNRALLPFFLCAVFPLVAVEPAAAPNVTEKSVFDFYRRLPRLSRKPYSVPMREAVLCAAPAPRRTKEEEKLEYGPHLDTRVVVYANEAGKAAVGVSFLCATLGATSTSAGPVAPFQGFPEGAMIVKEKLAPDNSVTGVGGMVKHAPGYDPENGNWEYFYAEKGGRFLSGHLTQCADCHLKAKKSDFIFGRWASGGWNPTSNPSAR